MIALRLKPLTALPLALLALGATACGAGTENAKVECAHTITGRAKSPCTVTFDREGPSAATVLGRDVELTTTERDRVTLTVAATEITVALDDHEAQEANLNITIKSIGSKKVAIRFSEVDV
ncbi:hypothetical protein HUT06_06535 [Actinomadura sp. NAK00032]|uniref:hypothetical protein n=1 Tax=Actinomadura sp. NAK00032 TaxID=2742128 RepID=UPI00159131A7|nr:hypothetical protein [Actinomadura sp. NAK00032]QKW33733.1 hypothetical protein HUT06_06535 [Actinomadura sp. NAK00032]